MDNFKSKIKYVLGVIVLILYDCLTEMGEMTVRFCNINPDDSYPKKVLKVFRQAEKENSCVQVLVDD